MDIFSKVGAVVTACTMAFSSIAVNAQYVSAENEIFPETLTITEKNYTGNFINSYNIDIDNDGIKERIGRYHIDKIDYSASDFYYTYNDDSEPYIMFKEPSNDHVYINVHIIQDNNTGETFFGYSYGDITESESLHKLFPDGQEQLIVGYNGPNYTNGEKAEYEKYLEYMQNVTFLDQTAYGKGDVDGDADITLSDASMMLSWYADNAAGLTSEINEIQKNAADMDKDGEITINDAATALSLYSEHAAGIIDTLLVPNTAKEDIVCDSAAGAEITNGILESVFYYDIDNDGKKETLGRYHDTNLSNTNPPQLAQNYVFQIYDNGKLESTTGGYPRSGGTGSYSFSYVLINDHNINRTYLALCTHGDSTAFGHGAWINVTYPENGITSFDGLSSQKIVSAYRNMAFPKENFTTIGSQEATQQELLDYISNLEIISPYADEADELSVFKYIFDTYDK